MNYRSLISAKLNSISFPIDGPVIDRNQLSLDMWPSVFNLQIQSDNEPGKSRRDKRQSALSLGGFLGVLSWIVVIQLLRLIENNTSLVLKISGNYRDYIMRAILNEQRAELLRHKGRVYFSYSSLRVCERTR